MRLLSVVAVLVFILLGATIGGLNSQPVSLDLGLALVPMHLGEALLAALLVGVLLGGATMWPARRRPSVAPAPPTRATAGPTPVANPSDDEE